jgi:hypothetical protein
MRVINSFSTAVIMSFGKSGADHGETLVALSANLRSLDRTTPKRPPRKDCPSTNREGHESMFESPGLPGSGAL